MKAENRNPATLHNIQTQNQSNITSKHKMKAAFLSP
jgi:hypothetical protein